MVKKKGSKVSASPQTHQAVNSSKRKAASEADLDDIQVKPLTPQEHRLLDQLVKRGNERRRRRYKEIHGKVVDWVSHSIHDGYLYVSIQFKDKTYFCLQFFPKIAVAGIDLSDNKTGDLELIREYPRIEQAL